MKRKEIIKKLDKFESNSDKLKYLEEILKDAKDKTEKEEIKELIEEVKHSLEEKIEEGLEEKAKTGRETEIPKIVRREVIEESETPKYELQPRRETLEQEVRETATPEQSRGYESGSYGIKMQGYDTTINTMMQDGFENIGRRAKDKLLIEGNISELNLSMDFGWETLGKKVDEMSPGINPEEKIIYIKETTSFNPDKKETKYLRKLR